jgi:hypothetical protein
MVIIKKLPRGSNSRAETPAKATSIQRGNPKRDRSFSGGLRTLSPENQFQRSFYPLKPEANLGGDHSQLLSADNWSSICIAVRDSLC